MPAGRMIEGVTPWGAVHISERQFLHIWNEFHGARRLDQSPNNEPSNLLHSLKCSYKSHSAAV